MPMSPSTAQAVSEVSVPPPNAAGIGTAKPLVASICDVWKAAALQSEDGAVGLGQAGQKSLMNPEFFHGKVGRSATSA